jgi:hypothetical protein
MTDRIGFAKGRGQEKDRKGFQGIWGVWSA